MEYSELGDDNERVVTVYHASDVERPIRRKVERGFGRKRALKVSYDADEDVLYFHFRDGPAKSVREIEDEVVVELDKKGEVMGIEVWKVKKKGVLKQLAQIPITR